MVDRAAQFETMLRRRWVDRHATDRINDAIGPRVGLAVMSRVLIWIRMFKHVFRHGLTPN